MSKIDFQIPFLDEIRVRNHSLPLWHAHWRGLVETAFQIRQKLSESIEKGGLGVTVSQHENTQRGIETLRYTNLSPEFTREKIAGVQSWLDAFCFIINQYIKGFKPINKLERCICRSTGFLCYYGTFYSNQMEVIIYIGSREYLDEALVIHRKRSEVDLKTRDWELLNEFLPQTVWIEVK